MPESKEVQNKNKKQLTLLGLGQTDPGANWNSSQWPNQEQFEQ